MEIYMSISFKSYNSSVGAHITECAQSHLILEAKRGQAWLILGWETRFKFSYLEKTLYSKPLHPRFGRLAN